MADANPFPGWSADYQCFNDGAISRCLDGPRERGSIPDPSYTQGWDWAKGHLGVLQAVKGHPGEHRPEWQEEAAHSDAPQAPLPAGEKFKNVSIE